VRAVAVDGAGDKWFGTNAGVSQFDGAIWTDHTFATTGGGLVSNILSAIAVDGADIWFAMNGGVSKFDGAIWTPYTVLDGLVNNTVYAIAIDGAGDKWFATNGGVSHFDGAIWTNYTNASTGGGLASDNVAAIAFDAAGNIWFATIAGVSKFDGAAWTVYTTPDLISNNVWAVAIDAVGHKWFGTDNGVSEFSTPPDAPTLSSPSNGATGISTSPTLIWNISVGATSYTLQVSLAINFSSFVFNQNVGNVTNKLISGLSIGTQYYWRVNASNLEGTSVWSSVWNFTTVTKALYQVPCKNLMIAAAAVGCMFYGIFRIIRRNKNT